MTHSASLRATGSEIAASACVASAGLCLRTSSKTFSSASLSACDVVDVAATAAGVGGLREEAGGKAACCRVAGAIAWAGTAGAAVFTAGVVLAAALAAVLAVAFSALLSAILSLVLSLVLGTTLRAIGRG